MLNAFRHHGVYRPPCQPPEALIECSTPFGITEYIGRRRRRYEHERLQVLNAFRHHGVYRPTPVRCARWTLEACSTPFGITEYIGVDDTPPKQPPPKQVLNAFRHHGVYRYRRRRQGGWHRPVLNAFRHHGVYRSAVVRVADSAVVRCSTPFGITEYIGAAS